MVKLLDWRARDVELEVCANPFAVVVQAHLAAQATRDVLEARQRRKVALIRGLYRRGFDRGQVLEIVRLIDWLLVLPEDRELAVRAELARLEEEENVVYVTSWERIGREEGREEGRAEGRAEGLLDGLAVALDLKFGEEGAALLPELRQIEDLDLLRTIGQHIKTAQTVDELRRLYRTTDNA